MSTCLIVGAEPDAADSKEVSGDPQRVVLTQQQLESISSATKHYSAVQCTVQCGGSIGSLLQSNLLKRQELWDGLKRKCLDQMAGSYVL